MAEVAFHLLGLGTRGVVTYGFASRAFAVLHVFVAATLASVVIGSMSPTAQVSNLAMANLHVNVIIYSCCHWLLEVINSKL